jgi:transcriptional regulator with XRE-family HTH domain|tara:strand:- start:644 stop:997 length:354 start_codon:yes stop_codon:yes gene_type:complete
MLTEFGKLIESERILSGLTRATLAAKCNLRVSNYSHYVNGSVEIPSKAVEKIYYALNLNDKVKIDDFFKLSGVPREKIFFRHYKNLSDDSRNKIDSIINDLIEKELKKGKPKNINGL